MDDYAGDLLAAVDAAVERWVVGLVMQTAQRQLGHASPHLLDAAAEAGRAARVYVAEELGALLATDVDEHRTNPLSVLRGATRLATAVLRDAGVPEVHRDEFLRRSFPSDVYALSPATWADVDPALVEPGLLWGAWKAATVLDRRRREGRRQ